MGKGKAPALSLKERRFVDAYLGSCAGNGTQAAKAAGYAGSEKVLGIQAVRLLAKARIRAAVESRQARAEEKGILAAEERDRLLSRIALAVEVKDPPTAISAVKELNKCTGRHSIKHLHEGKLTLEQALERSRTSPA